MSSTALILLVYGLLLALIGWAIYVLFQRIRTLADDLTEMDERHGRIRPNTLVERDKRRAELLRSLLSFTMESRTSDGKESSWPA